MSFLSFLYTLTLMRKLVSLFVLFLITGYLIVPVYADAQPTDQTTCDLCGKCTDIYLVPQPTPSNWTQCATCIYPPSSDTLKIAPDPDKAFTILGCVQTSSGGFTSFFVNLFTTIMSGVAFLGILYGAIKVMLARGNAADLNEGRRYVYGSILALLVVLFAVFIVKIVGGTILHIPYMQ